ncbi:hypothetical protein HN51_040353 [Arachis hypogaea]
MNGGRGDRGASLLLLRQLPWRVLTTSKVNDNQKITTDALIANSGSASTTINDSKKVLRQDIELNGYLLPKLLM